VGKAKASEEWEGANLPDSPFNTFLFKTCKGHFLKMDLVFRRLSCRAIGPHSFLVRCGTVAEINPKVYLV